MATLILMLIWCINTAFGGNLLPVAAAANVEKFKNYFTLATIFCGGIEFTLKRNIVFACIFAVIVVAVAAFMLYSDFAVIG